MQYQSFPGTENSATSKLARLAGLTVDFLTSILYSRWLAPWWRHLQTRS
jgi:hypothetical protein